jgi:hypothetical protein
MQRHTRTFQAGLLAAVLAATLQFVLLAGSLSGAFAQSATQLAAAGGGDCSESTGHHHHETDADCQLCPVCLSLTLPGLLPPPAPAPPVPTARAVPRAAPLPARLLLSSRILAAAYPRGPPLI